MLFTLLIKCRLIVLCSFASSSDAQKHYVTIQNTGNVDVNVTLSVYGTVCQYYNVTTQTWRTNGCEPSVEFEATIHNMSLSSTSFCDEQNSSVPVK